MTDLEKFELAKVTSLHQCINVNIIVDNLQEVIEECDYDDISINNPGDYFILWQLSSGGRKTAITIFQKGGPSDNDKSRNLQITPLFSLWEKSAN